MNASLYSHKIAVFGDSKVGKSSLIFQFIYGELKESFSAISADVYLKTISINGKTHEIQFLESPPTVQTETFGKLLKEADASLCVLSLTQRDSVSTICNHLRTIRNSDDMCMDSVLVVGNKMDLAEDRALHIDEIHSQIQEFDVKYVATSARTGENVEKMLMDLVKKVAAEKRRIATERAALKQKPVTDGTIAEKCASKCVIA